MAQISRAKLLEERDAMTQVLQRGIFLVAEYMTTRPVDGAVAMQWLKDAAAFGAQPDADAVD